MTQLVMKDRSPKHLKLKLDPLPADPRLAFVDRALTLMTDGRYGESRMSCLLVNSFGRCDIENAVFDVSELGLARPIDFDAIDEALDLCDPSLHPRLYCSSSLATKGVSPKTANAPASQTSRTQLQASREASLPHLFWDASTERPSLAVGAKGHSRMCVPKYETA